MFHIIKTLSFLTGYYISLLQGLVDEITEVLNQRRDDKKMSTDLTRTDIIKFKCVRPDERVSLRRLYLSGLDLSQLVWSNTVPFFVYNGYSDYVAYDIARYWINY